MTATKIMIIRHAEKPADNGPPYGVEIDGHQNAESLIPRGWQRAGALASFFASPRREEIASPVHLYASGMGKHSHSMRPLETITPLSQLLDLKINNNLSR